MGIVEWRRRREGPLLSFPLTGTLLELSLSLSFLRGMGEGALLLASRGIEKFADSKKREGNVGMAHPAPPSTTLPILFSAEGGDAMAWSLGNVPHFWTDKGLAFYFFAVCCTGGGMLGNFGMYKKRKAFVPAQSRQAWTICSRQALILPQA